MLRLKLDRYRLMELLAPILGFLASIVVLLIIAGVPG